MWFLKKDPQVILLEFSMKFSHILKIFVLISTALALGATSYYGTIRFSDGTFIIDSDCVIPTTQTQITVVAGAITAPPATSYTDFGFPQTIVNNTTISGTFGLAFRECTRTYGDSRNSKSWIFTCLDDGVYVCSIVLSNL